MRRMLIMSFVCGLALFSAQAATAQVTVLETTPQDYQALAKMNGVTARVLSFDPNSKTMVVRAEYQVPKAGKAPSYKPPSTPNVRPPNPRNTIRMTQEQQRLMREYQRIMQARNPREQQRRMAQFMARMQRQNQRAVLEQIRQMQQMQQQAARQQQNLQKQIKQNVPQSETVAKDFTLAVSDKVHVARKELGLEYDDKGNIKQYTPEELKKMKDDKLPGYKARPDDVLPGQMVYVYLAKPGGDAGKPKVNVGDILGGNEGNAAPRASGPMAAGIMILSDPDLSALPQGKKKR